jgi:diguanylate cyclase (GGDEF)-like protein/PAS domain S-box-containing protein
MPRNILLIQASASDATAVLEALSRSPNFHIEWANSCSLGLTRLTLAGKQDQPQAAGFSAVLVDLELPDVVGIDAFDQLYAARPEIPILILCSALDEDIAKLAIQRGAQDYLLIGRLDDHLLPKAIDGMIDRAANTEALFEEKERAEVTLNSIGDAVISTDVHGAVTYLNIVAQQLTGWPRADGVGRPLEEVFRIIDANTRATIANPMALATRTNEIVGLPPTCILIRRDGVESAIEDLSAPIHNRRGEVTGAVMVFRDVSMSRALSQKLAHLAQYDSLTDLPNRELLNERISQAITAAHRHDASVAVLYLDLDRFKHINDSLGHSVGDRLLQSVAHRLRECVRASDTVARLGGDEFVVLLLDITVAQDAATCADKIIQSIGRPYTIEGHELHITASIGIAIYPDDGTGLESLLQNADMAMYEAKEHGRNNYQFHQGDLNSRASARQVLENGLRHAIERNELDLHYQPIMNLGSGTVCGVEALLRWLPRSVGSVLPNKFISVAEESGVIVPIGRWVLQKACKQLKDWQRKGLSIPELAVNISAVELRSGGFVAGVAAILAETGVDPKCLTLELTETFIMQDSRATTLVLNALKTLGVQLALDDFGTGYSSLSYVRRFPIDVLKVDRTFVSNLTSNADDASIVSAVINMGKSLRMRVVAEGVETREQVDFLTRNGCPQAQGNYFNQAMKAEDIARLLRPSSRAAPKGPRTGQSRRGATVRKDARSE